MVIRPLVVTLIGAQCLTAQAPAGPVAPKIVVGPNLLVSRDADLPHNELMLVAAPWDPEVVVGTGTATTPAGVESAGVVYTSRDGGETWTGPVFSTPAGDPQVAVGNPGTLLFVGLGENKGKGDLIVARSEDLGRNWTPPINIGATDHPQLAVDHSGAGFRGRAYISGLGCRTDTNPADPNTYQLCLWRSADDGRSWSDPVVFEHGRDSVGYNTRNPLVLSDGTLVLPYNSFTTKGGVVRYTAWLVTSVDGGLTFTPRRRVHAAAFKRQHEPGISFLVFPTLTDPFFAVDTSARHRDRLYLAWNDDSMQAGRILVRSSDDRGHQWSAPIVVAPNAPADAVQSMPTVAVNKDGVVGVSWYDTRTSREGKVRHEYFAASVDGGATFLPAVRISDKGSPPNRYVNRHRWMALQDNSGDSTAIVVPVLNQIGDYVGLAADGHGTFQLLWEDTRSGIQHIYAATVRVESQTLHAGRPPLRQAAVAAGGFRVELEALRVDSAAGTVELPLRVRNLTDHLLYPPLRLRVTMVRGDLWGDSSTVMSFLNGVRSSSGGDAPMAEYDLASVLRDDGVLLPGERTRPLVLRLKAAGPAARKLAFSVSAGTPTEGR